MKAAGPVTASPGDDSGRDVWTAPFLLGIDYGTESCRVAIFDVAGRVVSFASTGYPTSYPHQGWAEQQVDDWYQALIDSTHAAMARSRLGAADIAGIGYGATSATLVALDRAHRPVRPAMMWLDVRASDQAARAPQALAAMARPGRARGVPASAEMFPFKIAWLKEHEPDAYRRTAHLLDAPDWLGHRLTGELRVNENSASVKMYHDRTIGGFPADFYASIGSGDGLEKYPHQVQPLGTPLGRLTASTAADLGLRPGIPVAEGCIDAYAGQIGLNVLTPGRMALITGSSHALLGQAPLSVADSGMLGTFADAVIPGQCTVEATLVSSGSSLRWFRDTFAPDLVEAAARQGSVAYDLLNEASSAIPPGSEGLVVVPYFQGTRNPFPDSRARAVVWGLSFSHTRAHVYHAVQESICYAVAHNLRYMADNGYRVESLVACGGATRSAQWMQMHADVTGLSITLTEVQDAVSLGACVMAATVAGAYGSLTEAADAMVRPVMTIEPDPHRHKEYAYFVDSYTRTYPALRDLQHDMSEHLASPSGDGA